MMNSKLNSAGKSILTGGAAAGVVSLIPVLNLLNLFLMMWMAAGGLLCAYLLLKANDYIAPSDAMVTGALSGAVGCTLFGVVTYGFIANISAEKLERILALVNTFSSSSTEDAQLMEWVRNGQLQGMFLFVMAVAFVFSLLSGALGGAVGRRLFLKKNEVTRNG